MDQLTELRGKTLVYQLNFAKELIEALGEQEEKSSEEDKHGFSQKAHLVTMGAQAEVARLLSAYHQDRGTEHVIEVLEYVTDEFDIEKIQSPYEDRDIFFDALVDGTASFARQQSLPFVVHVEAHECGHLDNVYWWASLRLDGTDLPFYNLCDHFDSREAHDDIAEVYGDFIVEYDAETEKMIEGLAEPEDED